MRWPIIGVALLLSGIFPNAKSATGTENCYDKAKIPIEKQVLHSSTIVLFDETVVFDETQQQHIRDQLLRLVTYGTELRVFAFSANIDGRYTQPVYESRIAAMLDDETRYTMRKHYLEDFDSCQRGAVNRAKVALGKTIMEYFGRSSAKLARSDILGTLKTIADAVFPKVKARQRRLVMVSDMLENSDVTSFYKSNALRPIDPAKELAMVEKKGLVGDLRNATVYVIGAGVVPTAAGKPGGGSYIPSALMTPLEMFWQKYFEASNARLVEFGKPLLLVPIGEAK